MDKLTQAVFEYPAQVDSIMQKVRESESYRETLRELVIRKRYSNTPILISWSVLASFIFIASNSYDFLFNIIFEKLYQ